MTLPAVGSMSRNSRRPSVDLPEPDLPDDAQNLAAPDVERNLRRRPAAASPAPEKAAVAAEVLRQAARADERQRGIASPRPGAAARANAARHRSISRQRMQRVT